MANQNHYPNAASIRRTVLPNGIVVLVYENFASQSVVVDGLVRAGAIAEPRSAAGLADFTAEMLLRGTQSRTFEQIYEELEAAGARLDTGGGRLYSDFSGSGLAEDLGLLLELAADAFRRPAFSAEHIEKVRSEIVTGLQMRANDTRRMAALAFRELLYGDHPYAQSVSGYLETVTALTRDQLVDFHRRYYGPQGMIITIVGAVKAEEALARVQDAFGDWHNPEQTALPAVPPAARPAEMATTHVAMPGKTQSDIVLGLPGPLRTHPDYLDVRLANTILGVFGMMGRLGKTVREEQGLAYYAYSRLQSGLGPSPWLVSTGVAPEKVQQALDSIRVEIRRLQDEPVPDSELADSQAYTTGSLPLNLETNGGIANAIGDMELYGLGLDYLETYSDLINAITPARIQAAAQAHFSADNVAVAVAGPLPA